MNISQTPVSHLDRPEGRLALTDRGSGPALVCIPGMGDTRATWDALAERLLAAGYRVIALDNRGHGDSDTTFRTHGDAATASDVVALLDELGEPAVLVGNSFGGSAAVIAAAEHPDAVAGLVLVSPFLREAATAAQLRRNRILFRLLFARPWGAAMWAAYYRGSLAKGARPEAFDLHVADLRRSFRDPRRLRAFRQLAVQLDHREVEPSVPRVAAPAIILVGALDPDYPDARAELAAMGEALHADTELVADAAHYAHAQRPEVVGARVLGFLDGLRRDDERWALRA